MSTPITILRRGDERLELPSEEWPKVLLRAEDWGWPFEQKMRISYLAAGTKVTASDAANLHTALQRILDAALKKPLEVYPIDVKIEYVYQIGEFCRNGEFTVEQVPAKGFYTMDGAHQTDERTGDG